MAVKSKLAESIGSLAKSVESLTRATEKLTKVDTLVKRSGDDFKKFGEETKKSTDKASKGIQMVADVLGQARAIGKDALAGITGSLASLATGGVKGAIEGIVDTVAGLSQALDLLIPGLGQATASLVKFAGGGIALLYELGEKTVEENQKLTEMRNTFDALGSRFNETGSSMLEHFEDLTGELPQTRAQLAAMAEPLIEAGIQGNKLVQSLEAQSAAQAMLGERGGRAYATLAQRARDAQRNFSPLSLTMHDLYSTGLSDADMAKKLGISVDQFSSQMRFGAFNAKQFGEALDSAIIEKGAKAQNSLMNLASTAMAKMRENIGILFQYGEKDNREGLDKFGKQLSNFGTIFDESTASGKMLHEVLHDMIDNTLSAAGNILTSARRGFKMLEIVFLTLYTNTHPLRRALHNLNKELGKSGHHGISFKSALMGIAAAATIASDMLSKLVNAATKVAAFGEKHPNISHQLGASALGAINPVLGAMRLVGHAEGGVVTGVHGGIATVKPADGEGLASIGRGEQIVPAGKQSTSSVSNVFHVMISGVGSSGEALELTEEALAIVFERARLKAGFG